MTLFPQATGRAIAGSFKDEFYSMTFRQKDYLNAKKMQQALGLWRECCNNELPHQVKSCQVEAPMEIFLDHLALAAVQEVSGSDGPVFRCRQDIPNPLSSFLGYPLLV
jgi:hypothetical protein